MKDSLNYFPLSICQNSYIVGSISVVIFTLSYYLAFPPVVRDRCLHYSNPQDPSLTHRPHYDVIVPYNSSWITEKSPQFQMTSDGNDVLVFLHMQVKFAAACRELLALDLTKCVRG